MEGAELVYAMHTHSAFPDKDCLRYHDLFFSLLRSVLMVKLGSFTVDVPTLC